MLAATLLVFLFAYLNLNRWHVRYSHVTAFWLVFLGALIGLAVIDPPVASGVARISIAAVAGIGFILVLHLATHGYDRAVMLMPTWFLLIAWVTAASFTVTGQLSRDLVPPALIGGLVLIVMLIGFTVMQHAFAGGAFAHGLVNDTERRALALVRLRRHRVRLGRHLRQDLSSARRSRISSAFERGALEGAAADWLDLMHPFDRDRYRASLDAVIEQRRGRLSQDFRLRGSSGAHHWFRLKARPVIGSDGEVIRVVGTLVDVTDAKTAEERLLHDAVHDNLTGLPNRQLFHDRLEAALTFASQDDSLRPTVIVLDIDQFKQINDAVGYSAGDSILLTLSRRLGRLLRPQDTLARVSGDEFAMILLSEREPDRIIAFADMVRRAVTTPITYAEREIFLTASIGLALHDPQIAARREDVLRNAEIAMTHAKRHGRRPDRGVPAEHALRPQRPAHAGNRSAPGARAQRDQGAVQADRAAGGPHHRGLRVDAALGPSASRPPRSRGFHGDRRGNRPDRQSRRLPARADRARTGGLAERARGRAADLRQRQHVEPSPAAPRPAAGREDRASRAPACCRAR